MLLLSAMLMRHTSGLLPGCWLWLCKVPTYGPYRRPVAVALPLAQNVALAVAIPAGWCPKLGQGGCMRNIPQAVRRWSFHLWQPAGAYNQGPESWLLAVTAFTSYEQSDFPAAQPWLGANDEGSRD
jgi:hypothetical protein